MSFTVNCWFTGQDLDELGDTAWCVRQAAGMNEVSSGTKLGPPLIHDMQFRCKNDLKAIEVLDRILVACPGVKGEVLR